MRKLMITAKGFIWSAINILASHGFSFAPEITSTTVRGLMMFRSAMIVYFLSIMTVISAFASGPSTGSGNNTAVGEFTRLGHAYQVVLQSDLTDSYTLNRVIGRSNEPKLHLLIDFWNQVFRDQIHIVPQRGLFVKTQSYVVPQFNSKKLIIDEGFWEAIDLDSIKDEKTDPIYLMIQAASEYLVNNNSEFSKFPDNKYKKYLLPIISEVLQENTLTFGEIHGQNARRLYKKLLELEIKPQVEETITSLRLTAASCFISLQKDVDGEYLEGIYEYALDASGEQKISVRGKKAEDLCNIIMSITEKPTDKLLEWFDAAEVICRYDRKGKVYSCQSIGGAAL